MRILFKKDMGYVNAAIALEMLFWPIVAVRVIQLQHRIRQAKDCATLFYSVYSFRLAFVASGIMRGKSTILRLNILTLIRLINYFIYRLFCYVFREVLGQMLAPVAVSNINIFNISFIFSIYYKLFLQLYNIFYFLRLSMLHYNSGQTRI